MKNALAIIVVLMVNFIAAQEEEAVLYFKNGTDLRGFVDVYNDDCLD